MPTVLDPLGLMTPDPKAYRIRAIRLAVKWGLITTEDAREYLIGLMEEEDA